MLRHAHTRRLGRAHGLGCAAGRSALRHAEEVPRASAARRRARSTGDPASQLRVGCAPGRRIVAGCAAGCSPCAAPTPPRPPRQRSVPAWARWQQPIPGSPGWRGAAHDTPHVSSDRPSLVPHKARGTHLAHLVLVLNHEVALQVGERPEVALPAVAAGQALNWRLCPKTGCHPHALVSTRAPGRTVVCLERVGCALSWKRHLFLSSLRRALSDAGSHASVATLAYARSSTAWPRAGRSPQAAQQHGAPLPQKSSPGGAGPPRAAVRTVPNCATAARTLLTSSAGRSSSHGLLSRSQNTCTRAALL
jgi:hypothetical protein